MQFTDTGVDELHHESHEKKDRYSRSEKSNCEQKCRTVFSLRPPGSRSESQISGLAAVAQSEIDSESICQMIDVSDSKFGSPGVPRAAGTVAELLRLRTAVTGESVTRPPRPVLGCLFRVGNGICPGTDCDLK